MISANAMVNAVVFSPLSDPDFNDKSGDLGVLCLLPLEQGGDDSDDLLQKLRGLPGLVDQ